MRLAGTTQLGARRAELKFGESVAVIGLGILGQLVVQYMALAGARRVLAIDTSPGRLAMARAHGATHTICADAAGARPDVVEITGGRMLDVVFDVTGHPAVLAPALLLLRRLGRLVLLGDTPNPTQQFLGPGVVSNSLTILGIHGTMHPDSWGEFAPWSRSEMYDVFLDYLAQGRMRVGDLITHRFSAAASARGLRSPGARPHGGPWRGVGLGRPRSMKGEKPRIGVLGSGSISVYHIEGLQAAGAEVAAVFSRDPGKAQTIAARYGIPLALTNWQALLERRDLDGVVIATPDFTHEEIATAAAQAGKPMLLQKPMARNSAECRRILAAARKHTTPLYVGFMHRYFPEIEATQGLLRDGTLGRLNMVRQRNATRGANWGTWFYQKALVGGGAVMQIGIHGIDLLQYLFGPIVAVQATIATTLRERVLADGSVVRPDSEDLALATYRFADGLLASHEVGYTEVPGTDRFRMEIYGDGGTAWLRTGQGVLAINQGAGGWRAADVAAGDAGTRNHRHWLAMLAGEAPDDGSAEAGLASVLVAEALYRSADVGGWQTVEPVAMEPAPTEG